MSRPAALPFVALIAQLGAAAALSAAEHRHHAPAPARPAPPAVTAVAHSHPSATPAAAARAERGPSMPLAGTILYGTPVPFGNGTARTLVAVDFDGKPMTVAVSFSETALDGLPAEVPADDLGWLYRLPLPAGIALPPYDHVGLYWNPNGHEPKGIYDHSHFDVHFFMTTPEQVDLITAMDRDLERAYRLPPPSTIPAGYILPPNTQHRRMGVHWVDTSSAELHGEQFTATFIIGSYDEEINFLEPMITRAFLASKPDLTRPVPQPAAFARAGWYPTTWAVRWDEERREYLVLLDGLRWQNASPPAILAGTADTSSTSGR
jgi:hypothetical protein